MAGDASPLEAKSTKGKSLSWKLPEDPSEQDSLSGDLLVAERLSTAVRDSINELLPAAIRDATAATLQKLSVATLKLSNFLDRMEAVDASDQATASAILNGAMSPRSVNSGILDKPRPTHSAASMERPDRIPDGSDLASSASSSQHLTGSQRSRGGDKVSPPSYQSVETPVASERHERPRHAGNAIATAVKTRKAVSVQGWNGSIGEEIFLPIPMNTPRRSIDESGASSEYFKSSKSPKLEKMGMKSLETRLARELFKTAKKPTKGFSCPEDCSLQSLSRQNSKAKGLGENHEIVPAGTLNQAHLKRGLSRESLPSRRGNTPTHGPFAPQAPSSNHSHPEAPTSVLPEMPLATALPAIPSQDLIPGEDPSTASRSEGGLNQIDNEDEHTPNSRNSQDTPKNVSGGRICTDPQLADGSHKRPATHTGRSKKSSTQLRDANHEELIRATIKSVNKIAPLSEIEPLEATVETGASDSEEEPAEESVRFPLLRAAGNKAVAFISVLNCSASVCSSRIATLLFQAVLMVTCLVSGGWLVANNLVPHFSTDVPAQGPESYFFYDVALAFGALCALLCGGCLRFSTPVGECEAMLDAFADGRDLHEDWLSQSRWDAVLVLTIWSLSVLERTRELFFGDFTFEQDVNQQELVNNLCNLLAFAVSAGVLLSCLFRIMRVCRGFYVIIDDFSFNLVTNSDLCVAEQDWNLLQALLRRSCHSLQYLFIVLQSTIVAALILGVDDFYRLSKPTLLISGAFVVIGLAQLFLCAASVTDHCERLPAFVNSLGFGRSLDGDRLYLVEYMFYSQAGFYIFEVRVTRDMVLKAFYISGMAIFYFATKVMAGGVL